MSKPAFYLINRSIIKYFLFPVMGRDCIKIVSLARNLPKVAHTWYRLYRNIYISKTMFQLLKLKSLLELTNTQQLKENVLSETCTNCLEFKYEIFIRDASNTNFTEYCKFGTFLAEVLNIRLQPSGRSVYLFLLHITTRLISAVRAGVIGGKNLLHLRV